METKCPYCDYEGIELTRSKKWYRCSQCGALIHVKPKPNGKIGKIVYHPPGEKIKVKDSNLFTNSRLS